MDNPVEAEAIKSFLEEHGVPSMIYGQSKVNHIPDYLQKTKVMVRKRYKADAERLISIKELEK